MSARGAAALFIVALGAGACGGSTSVVRNYQVENPDPDLVSMASTCVSGSFTSEVCVAFCKHLMVIGGDGAYQDKLQSCSVALFPDAGSSIWVRVSFDPG